MKRDPEEERDSCVWDKDDSWERNGDVLASLIEEGFGDQKESMKPFRTEEEEDTAEHSTVKSNTKLQVDPAEEDNSATWLNLWP